MGHFCSESGVWFVFSGRVGRGVVGGVGYFLLNIFLEVGWVGFILYLCMLKESVLFHYIMRCINYIGSFAWFFPLFLAAMLPLVTCCQ